MGKFKRKNNWKDKKDPNKKTKQEQAPYVMTEYVKKNEAFEQFYKLQLKDEFKSEQEFRNFMNTILERLPITFRINENVPNYQNFLNKLKNKDFITKVLAPSPDKEVKSDKKPEDSESDDGNKITDQLKLHCVPWYPRELVWQLSTFRHELKKNKAYQTLHKLIQQASDSGLITRQELVSMLPPFLLDIQGSDKVFDMCAAPGSKTSQMLESLYRDETLGKGLTTGGVLANDVDYERANMLIHQIQRISTAGMMVVNHHAQYFPTLWESKNEKGPEGNQKFYFDKILADVPCSGDGAIRKIPSKWQKWTPKDGTALHSLQLQILMRAVQLVKVGGLVLYSTCSINPIETFQDEAVVTEAFRRCGGEGLELVDIKKIIPEFQMRPGIFDWVVCDSKPGFKSNLPETEKKERTPDDFFTIYKSFDQLPKDYSGIIRPSMFPDTIEKMRDVYKIQNTMRIMPHDQNTGGFYLALIKKTKNVVFRGSNIIERKGEKQTLDEESAIRDLDNEVKNIPKEMLQEGEEDAPKDQSLPKKDSNGNEEEKKVGENQQKKSKKGKGDVQDKKATYVDFNINDWEWVKNEFGLQPPITNELLIQQNEGEKKVSYISPGIRKILRMDQSGQVVKLNMGVKAFSKNRDVFLGNKFPYRICQDAISTFFPFMTKKKVKCSAEDFTFFFQNPSIKYEDIPNEKLREEIKAQGFGSMVLYTENDGPIKAMDHIVCLNHANSVTPMLAKELVSSFKLRYMNDEKQNQFCLYNPV